MEYKSFGESKMKRIGEQMYETEDLSDEDKQTLRSFEELIFSKNDYYLPEEVDNIYKYMKESNVLELIKTFHVKMIISKINFFNDRCLIHYIILNLLTIPNELSFEVFKDYFIENKCNFQDFLAMNTEFQNQFVTIVSNIIYDNNNTIDYFIDNFANIFFSIFSNNLQFSYKIENLDDYFNLAYSFLPSIRDQETLMKIFHVFYLQTYNSNERIQTNALIGLLKIERTSYIMNEKYHDDIFFYERLSTLGRYQNKASLYTCYLLESLLNNKDVLFIDDLYIRIYELIIYYFPSDNKIINSDIRAEVIYMASFAINNENFRKIIDIEDVTKIMDLILLNYQMFSSSEKQKTIYFQACFINVLPIEYVENYFKLDDFIDILVIGLDISDKLTKYLVLSIYSAIQSNNNISVLISKNENIIECLKTNIENPNREIAEISSKILEYFSLF